MVKRPGLFLLVPLLAAVLGTGCASRTTAGTTATTACTGPATELNICVNGQRITFADQIRPHTHEGAIYAQVDVLAKALSLNVRTQLGRDGKSAVVTLNGKPFAPAMARGAKGVHVHDGHVFVPVREFVAAAGLKADVDGKHAGIAK